MSEVVGYQIAEKIDHWRPITGGEMLS